MPSSTLNNSTEKSTIKFLYSYGGKIVPRSTDGKLRYVGGLTRILTVDRSITYAELAVKFWDSCGGTSMKLRFQLPNEDLDVLVSVTSDEDLAQVVDVYQRTNQNRKDSLKIRVILDPIKSLKTISPPPSPLKFSASKPPKSPVQRATQRPSSPYLVAAGPMGAAYRRCGSAGLSYYSCHDERVR